MLLLSSSGTEYNSQSSRSGQYHCEVCRENMKSKNKVWVASVGPRVKTHRETTSVAETVRSFPDTQAQIITQKLY